MCDDISPRCTNWRLLILFLMLSACSADGSRGPEDRSLVEGPASAPHVIELEQPWIEGCGSGCGDAYLDLARRHPERGRTVDDEALERAFEEVENAPRPKVMKLDREALRSRIVRELNIGFLLDGLALRGLAVALLDESPAEGLERRKLLFWDPMVGNFEATLLVPRGKGPHPAVLGLHGHRDDDTVFAREFMGERLARAGYVVLMPRLRAHTCTWSENRIARELLRRGFTLMGFHVYEAMLMLKYLDFLAEVNDESIGLLSHSGGSTVANLLVRTSDGIAAQVTDYDMDFRRPCGPLRVHCETIPGMFTLSTNLRHRKDLPMPWLRVHYGFQEPTVRQEIVAFFDEHLR